MSREPETTEFRSDLAFGVRVHIDGDKDLKAVVTGFCWKSGDGHTIEVSWMHDGASQTAWLEAWRLQRVES